MAKIQVGVDTETKTLDVTINGVQIPDMQVVNVYTYRTSDGDIDSVDVDMHTVTKNIDGVDVRVSYYASASEKAKNAIASGEKVYKDINGFIGVEDKTQANHDVAKDIENFLSRQ